MRWRVQREWFGPEKFGGPVYPMWFAYPPERDRKPYMFHTWRAAMDWAVLDWAVSARAYTFNVTTGEAILTPDVP